MYFYVSPKDSKIMYPDNNSSSFTVNLDTKLHLSGCWQIALLQVQASQRSHSNKPLYILCDKVLVSFVGGRRLPVLRRVQSLQEEIHTPHYMTLKNDEEISALHFSILDAVTLKQPSFDIGDLSLVVHIKKHNHFNI